MAVAIVLDRLPYRPGKRNYIPIMIIALAAIEHRREFARAGRCGWEIGISFGDQLPYELLSM